MATFWQKTLFYLGLVDDDPPEGGEVGRVAAPGTSAGGQPRVVTTRPPGSVAGRRVDPPSSLGKGQSSWEHTEAGVYVQSGGQRSHPLESVPQTSVETDVIVARNFSDAQVLADGIRSGRAMVLDLRSTEPEMVRRLVDFTSGLTYALNGKMAKISQGVILVSPAGVAVSSDELDRLATLGLYRSH
ncbi:MAG TPA: cell division protein SepF [Acidimicrobiia bacterium]|nr:cell division protein SepF [Acidimicrobiia bacterium]